jgi:hypothetical protein
VVKVVKTWAGWVANVSGDSPEGGERDAGLCRPFPPRDCLWLANGLQLRGGGQEFKMAAKEHVLMEPHDNLLSLMKWEGLWRRVDVITVPASQYVPRLMSKSLRAR